MLHFPSPPAHRLIARELETLRETPGKTLLDERTHCGCHIEANKTLLGKPFTRQSRDRPCSSC